MNTDKLLTGQGGVRDEKRKPSYVEDMKERLDFIRPWVILSSFGFQILQTI